MDVNALNALSQAGAVVRLPSADGLQRLDKPWSAGGTQADKSQESQVQSPQDSRPVEAALSSIQDFVQNIQRNLNFALDDSSGRVVVKVTDAVSGEVIRQIPTEEVLKLAESLSEARSLLFQAEA